jgi:hypothetical protein
MTPEMPIRDLDLMRSARLLLVRCGENALIHVAGRADELLGSGDVEGCWAKVDSILEAARQAATLGPDARTRCFNRKGFVEAQAQNSRQERRKTRKRAAGAASASR